MDKCNDHWCDYFEKGREKCDRCERKQSEQDKTDISVILRRRAYRMMDVDKGANTKTVGQER